MTEKIRGNTPSIYFRYYNGTSQDSRNAVKDAVTDFYRKVGENISFLLGTTIFVADEYGDIEGKAPLSSYIKKHGDTDNPYTHGCTIFPELNAGKKEIIIKTEEYQFPYNLFRKSLKPETIKQGVLHEIGHQFDNYFGTKNKRMLNRIKNIQISDNLTKMGKAHVEEYSRHKDLSDSKEFKEAWKKDVEALGKDKKKYEKFKSGWTTSYYSAQEIDITDGVSNEEIEQADKARSEIFAQLFGYAFGRDDGYRKEIIQTYPNTYKMVLTYINKYLGVDCNIGHAQLSFLY